MIDAINHAPLIQRKTPNIEQIKTTEEIEKTAHDFTSVFFSEYVGIMLEESKELDEEFSTNIYRALHAQVLGEKLTASGPGLQMTDMMIKEISKMQRGHHA